MNVAVTPTAPLTDTVQVPVPEQAPPQPVNVDPPVGVAVNMTELFDGENVKEQVEPQAIPTGVLSTVPVPEPARVTVNVSVVEPLNEAVTAVAALSVTMQVPVPVHAPLQPANVDPLAGAAVSVTGVPVAKLPEHVGPQLMPAGALVTVPLPLPAGVTVSVKLMLPPDPTVKLGQITGHLSAAMSLSGAMQKYCPAFFVNNPPVIFEAQLALPLRPVSRKFCSK